MKDKILLDIAAKPSPENLIIIFKDVLYEVVSLYSIKNTSQKVTSYGLYTPSDVMMAAVERQLKDVHHISILYITSTTLTLKNDCAC